MARVLVVEDDTEMAELITYTLAAEGHDVRAIGRGQTALDEFPLIRPEAVVLDVSLPDRSGLDVCAAIREQSRVPVLFLTGRNMLQDKVRGFSVGGDDYLAKPFLPTELVLRVDALLRRSAWSTGTSQPSAVGDLQIDAQAGVVRRGGEVLKLSPMEVDLLVALASTPGVPWSPERLARRLGLPVDSPAEAAELVYVKITRLRRKVEPDPKNPRHVLSRRGAGYFVPTPETEC